MSARRSMASRLAPCPAAATIGHHAGVAQLVEHQLPKLRVVGSSPIARLSPPPERGLLPRRVSEDVYGKRVVEVEVKTADAARKLRDGNFESVWRALPDGSVQVARPRWGRVELFTVFPWRAPQLTEWSSRSTRKVLAEVCLIGSGVSIPVGVIGSIFVSESFGLLFLVTFIGFPLGLLLRWRSNVRPWLRERFGGDDDWAKMPWRIDVEPATGNQAISMSGLVADGGACGRYRIATDGWLELLTNGGKRSYRIDRLGNATEVLLPDARWLTDLELNPQNEWHEILTYDPTD